MEKEKLAFGFAFGLLNIDNIDKKYLDDDFFVKCVEFKMNSIARIPSKYITKNLCDILIKNKKINLYFVRYLPSEYVDVNEATKNCSYTPCVIRSLDVEYKTKEICEESVKAAGWLITYVPEEFMSIELVKTAYKTFPQLIRYIKDEYKTRDLCIDSLRVPDFAALEYIPSEMIDQEICDIAISYNKDNIEYVPEEYMKNEIINQAINENGNYLRYIPKKLITKELCELAISKTPNSITYVPKEYLTIDMCCETIFKDPTAIECIPEEYLDEVRLGVTEKYYNDYETKKLVYKNVSKTVDSIKRKEAEIYLKSEPRYDFSQVKPLEYL